MNQPNFWICCALVAAGIGLHFVKQLYELEVKGRIISPWALFKDKPYSSALVLISAYLLAALCYYVGELTYATAILIGVACNSATDTLRARAEAKFRNGT